MKYQIPGFPGSSATTNKQKTFMLLYNAYENSLSQSYVFLTSVIQHIISIALVYHRHVVTSKNMSLGWCLKITTRTPNLMTVGQLVHVEREDRQHSNLNFS
jgi:hypothetical protein